MKDKFTSTIFILIFTINPLNLFSQWSNDPAENTIIAEGGLKFPKIVKGNDFYFISYFKYVEGISLPFLCKINFNGFKDWGNEDLIVTDNELPSYPGHYDMKVDNENNAIIAIKNEIANQEENYISIYKISPSKESLWSNDGIKFQPGGGTGIEPQICLYPDNSFAIMAAVINNNGNTSEICLAKYTKFGEHEWNNEYARMRCDTAFLYPIGFVREEDNGLIVIYEKLSQEEISIFASKIDRYGNKAWANDIQISRGGLGLGSTFSISKGTHDEVFVAWTTYKSAVGNTRISVQGIYSDGRLVWENNPIAISNSDQCQNSPSICGQDSKDNIYVLWGSCDGDPNYTDSLMGQKISPNGELLWNSNGVKIAEGDYFAQIATVIANDTVYICYKDDSFHLDLYTTIKLVAIEENGNICWGGSLLINSEETIKASPQISNLLMDQGVICFNSLNYGSSSFGKIKMQNFWTDGTIGEKSSSSSGYTFNNTNPKISLNPSENIIEITNCQSLQKVILFDISGKMIQTWAIRNNSELFVQINCPHLNHGIYFIKLLFSKSIHTSAIYVN